MRERSVQGDELELLEWKARYAELRVELDEVGEDRAEEQEADADWIAVRDETVRSLKGALEQAQADRDTYREELQEARAALKAAPSREDYDRFLEVAKQAQLDRDVWAQKYDDEFQKNCELLKQLNLPKRDLLAEGQAPPREAVKVTTYPMHAVSTDGADGEVPF